MNQAYLKSKLGKKILLDSKNIILGRNASCHIVLSSKFTSSLHARIVNIDNTFIVFDLNSANGLFVNNEKVDKHTLSNNDKLRLADEEFDFVFEPKEKTQKIVQEFFIDAAVTSLKRPLSPFDVKIDPDQTIFILEENSELIPIIDYEKSNSGLFLEAIVFNEFNIISMDYIDLGKNRKIHLSNKNKSNHLFIPIATDVKDFVVFKDNLITVKSLDLFDEKYFRGDQLVNFDDQINLTQGDYYLAEQNDFKISICLTDSPPLIKPSPFIAKDKTLRKLLLFGFIFWVGIFSSFQLISVDKPILNKAKPKRIQKILYKPKKKINPLIKNIKSSSQIIESRQNIKKTMEDSKIETKTKRQIDVKKTYDKMHSKVKKIKSLKKGAMKVSKNFVKTKKATVQRKFNFNSQVKALKSAKIGLDKLSAQSGSGNIGSETGIESSNTKGDFGSSYVEYSVGANVGNIVGLKRSGTKGLGRSKGFFDSEILSETVVLGAMDPNLVREILRSYLPQFRYCYDQELVKQKKQVKGTVVYNFIIGPTGRTSRTQIGLKEFGMSRAGKQCMINVLKSIQFPRPKGGGIVEIRVPIYMEPEF